MAAAQLTLFDPPAPAMPEGFAYRPDLITSAQEQALASAFAGLPFTPYAFQAYKANRMTVSFGWRYSADGRIVERAPPIPDFLEPVRERVAALAGLEPQALEQSLVIQYPAGAPIGWHRDRPAFRTVMGVSLLSPALLRLRLKQGDGWIRASQRLEPRSAYVLDGPARGQWEHSIPPMQALRYSITFRTVNPDKADLFQA
jgi:alkylated DNA repair dioxygenase AlkB